MLPGTLVQGFAECNTLSVSSSAGHGVQADPTGVPHPHPAGKLAGHVLHGCLNTGGFKPKPTFSTLSSPRLSWLENPRLTTLWTEKGSLRLRSKAPSPGALGCHTERPQYLCVPIDRECEVRNTKAEADTTLGSDQRCKNVPSAAPRPLRAGTPELGFLASATSPGMRREKSRGWRCVWGRFVSILLQKGDRH